MNKKKLTGLLMVMVLLLTAGCGKGTEKPKDEQDQAGRVEKQEEKEDQKEEKPEMDDGDQMENEEQEEPEKKPDGKVLETARFDVIVPDGWENDEESFSEKMENSVVRLYKGDSPDDAVVNIKIAAYASNLSSFRTELKEYQVSVEDYAADNYDKAPVGGVDFLVSGTDDFKTYTHRQRDKSVTYKIRVVGEEKPEEVQKVIDGITLKLDGDGVEDAPWPWDGEPYVPVLADVMAGTFTIHPEYIPFEQSLWVNDIMEHRFDYIGNTIYHLDGKKLDTYEYSQTGMKAISSTPLDQPCEELAAVDNGRVYMAPGLSEIYAMTDGQKSLETEVQGFLSMSRAGDWGLTHWLGKDVMKVTDNGTTLAAEPWVLTGLSDDAARQGAFKTITTIDITPSFVIVTGQEAESKHEKLGVYDHSGNQLFIAGGVDFQDPDVIGHATGAVETENGIVVADGNMRTLQFWGKDGTHIGKIDVKELFGTGYPWLEDIQLMDDGSILVLLTQARDDGSADELMFFRLTGF